MNSSQKFAIAFQQYLGGDIYTDRTYPANWVVELDNYIFSESGKGTKGTFIPNEEVPNVADETFTIYYMIAQKMYDRKIITTFLRMFPNYSESTKFNGQSCILLDQKLQKKFYLKVLRKETVSETVSYVIAINRQLSGLGLTPPLYLSGHMDEYGYLVMEYLPITAEDAIKRKIFTKDVLVPALMDIVNMIHSLQIYNLDVHWQNFLYDDKNNIIYMIDFDDAKVDPPKGYNLEAHRQRLLSYH